VQCAYHIGKDRNRAGWGVKLLLSHFCDQPANLLITRRDVKIIEMWVLVYHTVRDRSQFGVNGVDSYRTLLEWVLMLRIHSNHPRKRTANWFVTVFVVREVLYSRNYRYIGIMHLQCTMFAERWHIFQWWTTFTGTDSTRLPVVECIKWDFVSNVLRTWLSSRSPAITVYRRVGAAQVCSYACMHLFYIC